METQEKEISMGYRNKTIELANELFNSGEITAEQYFDTYFLTFKPMQETVYQTYDRLRVLHNQGLCSFDEVTIAYKNLPKCI